jgi:glutaredoxin 3
MPGECPYPSLQVTGLTIHATEMTIMSEITLYTKSWCPYCASAKRLLAQKGASFIDIDIEARPEKRAEMIEKAGGRTTVPQIFLDGRHIGGSDDLHALDRRGQLDPLLLDPEGPGRTRSSITTRRPPDVNGLATSNQRARSGR